MTAHKEGEKKFVLVGSRIMSNNDGDWHFIPANRLAVLYKLNPNECIFMRDVEEYKRNERALPENAIVLWPRSDGNYNLL